MSQKKAPPVLPRRRTPFTRKRILSFASKTPTPRTCVAPYHGRRRDCAHRFLRRLGRAWHLTMDGGATVPIVPRGASDARGTLRCHAKESRLVFDKKGCNKAAFVISEMGKVVKPCSKLSRYRADRYRARDGKGWFPAPQASPKYAPSRSCRTNAQTSARIC